MLARSTMIVIALGTTIATSVVAQGVEGKSARATRTSEVPRDDGRLDDAGWATASVVSDFVQKIPNEGSTPSERTEVRLLYDDEALYVGARLRRSNPEAIRRSVTRRDGTSDAEEF